MGACDGREIDPKKRCRLVEGNVQCMSSMSLVQVECGEVIIDHEDFVEALQEYDKLVENKQSTMSSRIDKVLSELYTMKAMFKSVGLLRIDHVFGVVSQIKVLDVIALHGWRLCALSGNSTQNGIQLSDGLYVCKEYEGWIWAVWVLTHLQFIEQQRLAMAGGTKKSEQDAVSVEEAARVYADAVRRVWVSFEEAYKTLRESTQVLKSG